MMRYQVRVTDPADYTRVAAMLRQEANVVLELPRRRTLAVEDLDDELREQVTEMGATVELDYQYAVGPTIP